MRHARLPDAPDKTAGLTTSREQIIAALLDDRPGMSPPAANSMRTPPSKR
jgi:hypothetical protein